MPFTQGASLKGRQILGTVLGNETRIYVNLRTSGLLIPKFRAYVALEYIGTPYPYQLVGRSLYSGGVVFENGGPFTLDTQIVAYWREAGLLWRAEWE